MGFEVYDCRRDIRNILVRPQVRARFCRLEPGTGSLDAWNTHDLGDEIFIILSGRVELKINGEVKEVGPGPRTQAGPNGRRYGSGQPRARGHVDAAFATLQADERHGGRLERIGTPGGVCRCGSLSRLKTTACTRTNCVGYMT